MTPMSKLGCWGMGIGAGSRHTHGLPTQLPSICTQEPFTGFTSKGLRKKMCRKVPCIQSRKKVSKCVASCIEHWAVYRPSNTCILVLVYEFSKWIYQDHQFTYGARELQKGAKVAGWCLVSFFWNLCPQIHPHWLHRAQNST